MNGESPPAGLTRREAVGYGGAAAAGLLAGCTGGDGGSSTAAETEESPEATADPDDGTATETEADPSSYEACIEPAGCLTFEEAPETYAVYNGGWRTWRSRWASAMG